MRCKKLAGNSLDMDVVNENITQDYKYEEFVILKQPYYYLGVLVIIRYILKKQSRHGGTATFLTTITFLLHCLTFFSLVQLYV
jgi:hypothetical protein